MARTPNAQRLVEKQEGSALAKDRLRLFLETIGGKCPVERACAELKVKAAAFYRMRDRWLAESVQVLEPRTSGPRPRDRTVSRAEVAELAEKIVDLERQLKASAVKEELGLVMPGVVKKKTT